MLQSDFDGLLLADDLLPAVAGIVLGGVPLQVAVEPEHPAGSGVDGVIIFLFAHNELHFVFLAAVLHISFRNEEEGLVLGYTGVFQGSFLGLCQAHILGGGSSRNSHCGDEQSSGEGACHSTYRFHSDCLLDFFTVQPAGAGGVFCFRFACIMQEKGISLQENQRIPILWRNAHKISRIITHYAQRFGRKKISPPVPGAAVPGPLPGGRAPPRTVPGTGNRSSAAHPP